MEIANQVARSCVLDTLIGVEEVVADLGTKARLRLQVVLRRLFFLPFLRLQASQGTKKHLTRRGSVLVLTSFVLALHDLARGKVGQPDRAGGLVDMLAASTAGAESVFANVLFPVDFNVD